MLFAALVLLTIAGLLALAGRALSAGGLGATDALLLVLFGLTLPWSVIGFWNATIGFLVMRLSADPVATVLPAARRVRGDEPITASTAIAIFVRNEPPERVIRNLDAMMGELAAAGVAGRFHLYVLSDTSQREIAALEEKHFSSLEQKWRGRIPVTYRRRTVNTAFKAGNFWDFCERWGDRHEFAVTLDTDSFMTAAAILRMVRIMQAEPKLGILQGLVVGLPSTSAFARIFQFGMRLGMRSWTIGSAWWQADCGPYWGHNGVIRIAQFKAHCHIPKLPEGGVLGGHVLSHDQIEAALMRRAGYDVRVLPEEDLGWEENPPTLIEYLRRDQRWEQGTLQYGHFIFKPGMKIVSRFQLGFAMLMFLGSPAWIGMLVVGTLAVALAPTPARLHRSGDRLGADGDHPGDVVRAQDRDRARRAHQAGAAPRVRRHGALPRQRRRPRRSSSSCCRRSCGSRTRCSWPACRSARRWAGSARCATTTPFPGRRPGGSSGRTPCSALDVSGFWHSPTRAPFPTRC